MAFTDQRGLPISTTSPAAAEFYRSGTDLLLSLWPGADDAISSCIESDPNFALGHAAQARLYAIKAQPDNAKIAIARANDLVQTHGSLRERSHVKTLSLAINNQLEQALTSALAHIDSWPRDLLIFALPLGAFGLFAFSGMSNHDQARVDLCERYSSKFSKDDWWFLTYRGWSHAENGNLSFGREQTLRALELRTENANAAHAVAHVLYESGANTEVQSLIESWLPKYDRSGILHGHIAWHAALTALEQGDIALVLKYYRNSVAPSASKGTPVNIISDCASLLWRLQAYGNDVLPELWQEVAEYASPYFKEPGFPFADFHMALIATATGATESLKRRIDGLEKITQSGQLAAGAVVPALCRAAEAFSSAEYCRCIDILEAFTDQAVRIGGSGAQRDIIEDMLVISYLNVNDIDKSMFMLNKRLRRRPSARDQRWLESVYSTT